MKTHQDLFLHFLQDVYYAERQIVKALPKMAKAAESPTLKAAFNEHLQQTHTHVERLQKVFETLGKPARSKTCEAIQGLIEEGEEVIGDFDQGAVRDAGLVACAQAVEHYEIARYGALIAWAKGAGQKDVVALLQQTIDEEKATDQKLNGLAGAEINQDALKKAA